MVNCDHRAISARPMIFLEENVYGNGGDDENMTNIKFVVRVTRKTRPTSYVQCVDRTSFRMTTNRNLALMMGKLTAEDAAKTIENAQIRTELVPVEENV